MLNKLVEIVKRAGNISLKYYGRINTKQIMYKDEKDIVTKI